MLLYVNGQDIAAITFGLFGDMPILETVKTGPEGYLDALDKFLANHDRSVGLLKGAVVVTGPGSATALRGSLAIMNTLAFAQGLKLHGVEKPVDQSDLIFTQSLDWENLGESSDELEVTYARGPKITKTTRDQLRRPLKSVKIK